MNIIKFAEALGIDTTCEKQELDKLRIEYCIGIDTARAMVIEPKIYERIKELVKFIQEVKINKIEELKAENERLKEDYIKLSQQKDLDNVRWQKRCTNLHIEDKAKADKYWLVLQKIKEIAMSIMDDDIEESSAYSDARQIIDLITKVEILK